MNPKIFQARALEIALRLYSRTRVRVNRAYTPSGMMATASRITGKKFKAKAYIQAADALAAWAKEQGS